MGRGKGRDLTFVKGDHYNVHVSLLSIVVAEIHM